MVFKEHSIDEQADILGELASKIGVQRKADKYNACYDYVMEREKVLFNAVSTLYKATMAVSRETRSLPAELMLPEIVMTCDYDAGGSAASYDGHVITIHKEAFELYEKMEQVKRHGNPNVAAELAYQLDQTIGHELGHVLLHAVRYRTDRNYRYEGAYRRQDDGLAEVIGYYAAQLSNDRQIDNISLATEITARIRQNARRAWGFMGDTLAEWNLMSNNEKINAAYEAEVYAERLAYYDYPLVGFVRALRTDGGTGIAAMIDATLQEPQNIDGVVRYVIGASKSATKLAKVVDCDTASMLIKKQFALMADVCHEIYGGLA